LGIGDWAQSPIPNPQSPIPIILNYKLSKELNIYIFLLNNIKYFLIIIIKYILLY